MTQNEKVLQRLRDGERVTAKAVAVMLDVWRLSARIAELRAQGHDIETEMVTNGRVRYARYRLVK